MMTIQEFRTITSTVPSHALRQAMVVALSVETPRNPTAYARFYCRVLGELGVTLSSDCDPTPRQAALVAA